MTRQAITTKYIGPTNTRGSRIKASAQCGSVTISYDDSLRDPHTEAAKAFAVKMGWAGHWYGGGLPDGKGNCYVLGPESGEAEFVVSHAELK